MNITNSWHAYAAHPWGHTVVGDVRTLDSIYSPELRNQRKLYVYLPPSYAQSDRHYPVIYMQDGQNLFDQALSYAGEWQVDETMEALSREGIEAIVVGVPNAGVRRIDEYSPFKDQRLRKGGRGDWYVAFLANTVKPLIDRDFRTLPEREHTGVLGSSMGGLISLYALFCRPEVFGFAGAMSPSLWFAHEAIFPYVQQADARPGRIIWISARTKAATRAPSTGAVSTYTSRYFARPTVCAICWIARAIAWATIYSIRKKPRRPTARPPGRAACPMRCAFCWRAISGRLSNWSQRISLNRASRGGSSRALG